MLKKLVEKNEKLKKKIGRLKMVEKKWLIISGCRNLQHNFQHNFPKLPSSLKCGKIKWWLQNHQIKGTMKNYKYK